MPINNPLYTFGDDNNYTEIQPNGLILRHGTARTLNDLWIGAQGIKAPGVKPATWVDHGISGVWQFADGNDETLVANIRIANRTDRSVPPTFTIGWASASTGNCEWQIEYLWTGINENTIADAQETLSVVTAASAVANGLVASTVTLQAPSATDVCIHIRIKRLAAGGLDTIVDTVELIGTCIQFVSNTLGTAT